MQRGAPERQVATCARGSSNERDAHWWEGHRTERFRDPGMLDEMWKGKLAEENLKWGWKDKNSLCVESLGYWNESEGEENIA